MKLRINWLGKFNRLILLGVFFHIAFSAASLDFTLKASGTYSTETNNAFFVDGSLALEHQEGPFSTSWSLVADSKGTYPAPFFRDFFGPFTFNLENAGFVYQESPISMWLGKLPIEDEIESPYSLFISGKSPSLINGGLRFEGRNFTFSNLWVGLDTNARTDLFMANSSKNIYRDRGVVIRTYAYQLGNLKVGYQDSTVFVDSYFNVNVFAIPAPSYFVQYVLAAKGRPGSQYANMNSLEGLFADYKGQGWRAYAQVLIDDFNMNRFINPSGYQNPDKIAWSLGGAIDLPLGTLGIYTAGATKYSFASLGEDFYSYTTHPSSAVISDGQTVAVPLEEQMLGYIHGENNIALKATWGAPLADTDLEMGMEIVLSGAKSPANPWHNGEDYLALGTQLLNDPVLETKILLDVRASREFGNFTIFARAAGGYIFNRLTPVYPGSSGYPLIVYGDGTTMNEPIFIPKAGDSGLIGEISLGGSWKLGL